MQDEGYPPPAEMPIKKLEFTPFKPPQASKVSDASSKESMESAESAYAESGSIANTEVQMVLHILSVHAFVFYICECVFPKNCS